KAGVTLNESEHHWRPAAAHLPANAPNVLIIMLDDVGFAHADTVGGMVHTPTFSRIADSGIRYNTFHATAISSATRASLLTGRNPHHVGFGTITEFASDFDGYTGTMPKTAATVAEVLKQYGYSTAAFGKWHNTPANETSPAGPYDHWPTSYGFEHFYGFLAAETSQYSPRLFNDNTPIEPPHDPKYHLSEDLTNQAVNWLKQHHTFAGNKPFLMYWAPGATHAPHQVAKEWADKYKGKFDAGWDVYRQQAFEHQRTMGWIPADAKLTPRPDSLPAWDSLTPEEKRFNAREMEVFAGFLEHVDTQAGKVIDELEREGVRDNTLVIYQLSDNGASAEGVRGTINEMLTINGVDIPVSQQIKVLNEQYGGLAALGGPKLEEHYNAGWAWAAESPFQGTKLVAGYFGGTRTPLAISWPKGIKADRTIRTQFEDVTDLVPTIYDVIGIKPPTSVNGVEQMPFDGVSMRNTFADPSAPSNRHAQYFENFGSRAMYQDGWIASVFGPRTPWVASLAGLINWDPRKDKWSLYDVSHDYSQAVDVADQYPQKLAELQRKFDEEARANNVYPIGAGMLPMLKPSERVSSHQVEWHFGEDARRLPDFVAPRLGAVSNRVTVEVDVPAKASGVLYKVGGTAGGVVLYFDQGHLHYEYNAMAVARTKLQSPQVIPPGHHRIEVDTQITAAKRAAPADLILRVDSVEVAKATTQMTASLAFSASETFDVGANSGSPVSLDYFDRVPFQFNGHIADVHVVYLPARP
ncbi:MAG: arylsulfatase, partial [Ralstonia sp.]